MSLLARVENFIKSTFEETTGTTPGTKKTGSTNSSESVIRYEINSSGDTLETTTQTKKPEQGDGSNNKTENGPTRGAVEATLKNIPSAEFDIEKMIKNGLIDKITGRPGEKFDKLPPREKTLVITAVKYSIARFEALKKQDKINKNASPEELVTEFSKVLYEALASKSFESAEEFENQMGDISAELGEDFQAASPERQRQMLKKNRMALDKRREAELEAVKKLPEAERRAEEQGIYSRYRYLIRGRYVEASARFASETAVRAIIILNSEDMQYGADTVLATRSSQEERTRTADYADYNFTKGLIEDYREVGDPVQAASLKGYTVSFMAQKSTDAVLAYHEDYKADRDKYEAAKAKQARGETLTSEEEALLTVMSTEYYTATAQGIGEGALANVNMTTEAKAAFLSAWDNDSKRYSDYEAVVQSVKTQINTAEEYKEIKARMEEIRQAKASAEKTSSAAETDNAAAEKGSSPSSSSSSSSQSSYVTPVISSTGSRPVGSSTTNNVSQAGSSKNTAADNKYVTPPDVNINQDVICKEIRENGVKETITKYGNKAIVTILDNQEFDYLRPRLATYLKAADLNTLKKITTYCSDEAFCYICSVVREDYIENLKDNREHTRGLCYAAAQTIEGKYASD